MTEPPGFGLPLACPSSSRASGSSTRTVDVSLLRFRRRDPDEPRQDRDEPLRGLIAATEGHLPQQAQRERDHLAQKVQRVGDDEERCDRHGSRRPPIEVQRDSKRDFNVLSHAPHAGGAVLDGLRTGYPTPQSWPSGTGVGPNRGRREWGRAFTWLREISSCGVARRAIRPSPKDASGRRCERRGAPGS